MTILQIASGLQKASGVTTFVENVVRELKALGHVVVVCTRATVSDPKALLPTLRTHRPDVIHIHGLWDPWLHAWAQVARRLGVPVVWSTHGMTAPWAMHHKWWKKWPCWWLYQRRDLKSAARIHCTTELEVEWNHKLGFTNTFTVPLGTSLTGVRPSDVRVASGVRTILFVGRVYPVKALENVIRSIPLIAGKAKGVRFRIVGPDQAGHQAELERLCAALSIPFATSARQAESPVVVFAGPKYGEELAAEYDACDVLILPSHTENFGATVIDALAHRRPALASTKTPWKVLAERRCGWWVDNSPETLAKAFAEIAAMPEDELQAMGERGRKLVEEQYAWPAVARRILESYGVSGGRIRCRG